MSTPLLLILPNINFLNITKNLLINKLLMAWLKDNILIENNYETISEE